MLAFQQKKLPGGLYYVVASVREGLEGCQAAASALSQQLAIILQGAKGLPRALTPDALLPSDALT